MKDDEREGREGVVKERRGLARRLALEFVVIVTGVLVALGVDQWAERRANDELAREMLASLAAELAQNRAQIERRIEYHESILPGLDSLRRAAESGEPTNLMGGAALPEGIGFWLLRDTAWETALVTEAVRHFDLEVTQLLSITYALQETLREAERVISSGVIRPEWLGAADQGGATIFLDEMLGDLLANERELASFLRASLEAIAERLGTDEIESPVQVSVGEAARGARPGPGFPARSSSAPATGA